MSDGDTPRSEVAPDQDIDALKKQLQDQLIATQNPAPVAPSIPALAAPSPSGSGSAQDTPILRDRHVTGADKPMEVEEEKVGYTSIDTEPSENVRLPWRMRYSLNPVRLLNSSRTQVDSTPISLVCSVSLAFLLQFNSLAYYTSG